MTALLLRPQVNTVINLGKAYLITSVGKEMDYLPGGRGVFETTLEKIADIVLTRGNIKTRGYVPGF